jgi:hypothetical protein
MQELRRAFTPALCVCAASLRVSPLHLDGQPKNSRYARQHTHFLRATLDRDA